MGRQRKGGSVMVIKSSESELGKMLKHEELQLKNAILETDRIVWQNVIVDIKRELDEVK